MILTWAPTWTAALTTWGELRAVTVEGKRSSMAVFDTKVLATTGRFFFSDGSSLEPSAGLFTPPAEKRENTISVKHLTVTRWRYGLLQPWEASRRKGSRRKMYLLGGWKLSQLHSWWEWNGHFLTGMPSFEVVVVLGDIGENAQPVWDP